MAFLQKAIDATIFTIGKTLAARPSKIVAGHEPENTNIWLQAMAYAVRKKVSGRLGLLESRAAVLRALSECSPCVYPFLRGAANREAGQGMGSQLERVTALDRR